jgi:hypothetical protein
MPNRVNLPRIADVSSWIALEDYEIGKFAGGQHAAIIKLQQRRGIGGGIGDRL